MRHPDFFTGPAKGSTADGRHIDERLCDVIKKVWRDAGYLITAQVVFAGNHSDKAKNPVWGIRSNLVNGLPSGKPLLVRP